MNIEEQNPKNLDHKIITAPAEVKWSEEKLKSEIELLYGHLNSLEVQKLNFGAVGGEGEILAEIKRIQKVAIPQIYRETVLETPHLPHHYTQANPSSCQLASAVNVLEALGCRGTTTEKDIAKYLKNDGLHGTVWPSEIIDFLQTQGLIVQEIHNAFEAIRALIGGSKIILPLLPPSYPKTHSVVISGVKINHGRINFYGNDPQHNNTAEILPLNYLIDYITPSSYTKLTPTVAITKP